MNLKKYSDTLNKKRNVPELDNDILGDVDGDLEKSKPNLMDLVNNARSQNPEIQLNAIQCKHFPMRKSHLQIAVRKNVFI